LSEQFNTERDEFFCQEYAMRQISYAAAATEAMLEEMRRDPKTIYLATDAPSSLIKEFGTQRVRGTPITEAAFTGMAIGAAGSGYRPIVNWSMVTFSFVAMDQIVNQASKIHYMFGGQARFPIVFRASVGGGRQLAAQHSQSPYSMFMNLAGLKLILPSTPVDMKGLLKAAIRDNNPVISFESSRLMGIRGEVPDEEYIVPLGKADVKREGSDVTVVALAWMVHEALAAAETLQKEGIAVEVIDPRTLVPMDAETIRASVQKTGRLVVADEAGPTAGAAAEISALVTEDPTTFRALKAPVKRVCALQVPIPYSPQLESHVFPNREKIAAGVRGVMENR
jgi:pyruvate/2-oxoglutarate/acetoin dehydrogenase E1 component